MTVDGPYLNIRADMWQALCDRHSEYRAHDELTANAIGGKVSLRVGRISSFDIGPLHFDNLAVVIQPAVGTFASPDAVGFIALDLFEPGGWLTFDFPNGRLYL
jgi:hypothetical protein